MFLARVFTLYPNSFPGPLKDGLYGKALLKKLWDMEIVDIRKFAEDKHKVVDDTPYGGGSGMVLKPDVIARSIDRKNKIGSGDRSERIRTYNFPQGRVTDHRINLTLHKLEEFMQGEVFDEIIESLSLHAQEEELKNLEK